MNKISLLNKRFEKVDGYIDQLEAKQMDAGTALSICKMVGALMKIDEGVVSRLRIRERKTHTCKK
jgi:hypothetical protein